MSCSRLGEPVPDRQANVVATADGNEKGRPGVPGGPSMRREGIERFAAASLQSSARLRRHDDARSWNGRS